MRNQEFEKTLLFFNEHKNSKLIMTLDLFKEQLQIAIKIGVEYSGDGKLESWSNNCAIAMSEQFLRHNLQ